MTQVFNIISIVAFALAGFFFLLSIFFWFYFRILKIINDLSGRSAKKAIEAKRRENEKAGSRARQPSMGVGNREKPASPSGQGGGSGIDGVQPGEADRQTNSPVDMTRESLYQDARSEYEEPDTGLLEEETGILDGGETGRLDASSVKPVKFFVLQDIVLIHTDEVI